MSRYVHGQAFRRAIAGLVLTALLVALFVSVPVPFITISRGPTFDTLGAVNDVPVVQVKDLPTYPTSGHLNMTTVSVTDGITGLDALRYWLSDDHRLLPRTVLLQPGETAADAAARNERLFLDSQQAAEAAALGHLGLPTTVVAGEIIPGGPAVGALRPGDVIVQIAGRDITGVHDLRDQVSALPPGQQVTLTVDRPGQPRQDVVLVVGRNPATGAGFLGILPIARPAEDEIDFTLGDIGGPSAGLMFALATVDKLTPGELTGGRFVAGTGTIDSTGLVGEIQGIRFKMLAAREAGATVFLVPEKNCEEARSVVPVGLQTVRVHDIAGAITALDTVRAGGTPPSC